MVIKNKKALIEKLTGIHSSKKSYYVELKKKIYETTRRNIQLEIINQLAKGIGIEMSFQEIIESVIPKMQAVVSFDTLSLYVIDKGTLVNRTVFVTNHESGAADRDKESGEAEAQKGEKATESFWQVLSEKKTILVDHRETETPGDAGEGLPAMVLIPLLVKEKV
ncbi:MAG TPA: hypothetical protein PKY23_07195, partial [Bacillota bacterium]|nr:hypothetical protein [Bacillota bacterium]